MAKRCQPSNKEDWKSHTNKVKIEMSLPNPKKIREIMQELRKSLLPSDWRSRVIKE